MGMNETKRIRKRAIFFLPRVLHCVRHLFCVDCATWARYLGVAPNVSGVAFWMFMMDALVGGDWAVGRRLATPSRTVLTCNQHGVVDRFLFEKNKTKQETLSYLFSVRNHVEDEEVEALEETYLSGTGGGHLRSARRRLGNRRATPGHCALYASTWRRARGALGGPWPLDGRPPFDRDGRGGVNHAASRRRAQASTSRVDSDAAPDRPSQTAPLFN